jgi:endogenous inhibitor of DNA gyrase (YacG/DUF329 family)
LNVKQREQVSHMRNEGYGYSRIAQALGISENTVKSYCKRNQLGGRTDNPSLKTGDFCRNCGKPLEQIRGRKTRKFCSDKCRVTWWNTHPEQVKRKAVYDLKCAHCGAAFESYGNGSRKFCSHSCYISNRFGLQEAART